MATPLETLIEGGLPQLKGFQPTPENKSREDHEKWWQFQRDLEAHFYERFAKPKDEKEDEKKH